MRPSGSPPKSDKAPASDLPASDLDEVMRAGDRVPIPTGLPSFRAPIIAAIMAVAIWGGIALFWPVPKRVPLRLCGHDVQTTSCVVHH